MGSCRVPWESAIPAVISGWPLACIWLRLEGSGPRPHAHHCSPLPPGCSAVQLILSPGWWAHASVSPQKVAVVHVEKANPYPESVSAFPWWMGSLQLMCCTCLAGNSGHEE